MPVVCHESPRATIALSTPGHSPPGEGNTAPGTPPGDPLFCWKVLPPRDKRVSVGAEFGHDERNAMLHKPRKVVNVMAEPIQLGNNDRRTFLTGAL